jgi:two-component system sensor histidine kinase YesM
LEYYAEIQKIRFGDVFSFQVDFPEEVAFLSIPNLLLQPLVENSIVHGLKGKNAMSHIKVSAEIENEMLKISVWDDGCGMCAGQLEDIRCEMKNYEGDGSKYFALVNITARLHNRYREHAFIRIDSQEGKETIVVIGIPMDEVS